VVAELGVSDARLEEGSIRFDANVSIRPDGDTDLGTKVEIKNMNSFRSLERAVEYEMARQVDLVETGGEVVQETRHWEEESAVTHSMRTKEGSSDYRYFTEPDLVPMVMDDQWVATIRSTIPELPAQRRARLVASGLESEAAAVLSASSPQLRQIYEDTVGAGAPPRAAANWVVGDLTAAARRSEPEVIRITGNDLAELISLVDSGRVSTSAAKEVLEGVLGGEGSASQVAEERDLIQITDVSQLIAVVDDIIEVNPKAVSDYRSGETKIVGFLVGQVMKATMGKADPKAVNDLVRERLED
jgi:aspartyl-tRNA(Asn)/glutamyl-tRNA(Gln) amidotransferase subunit B